MATINREQALQAQDLERELVNVPEWGGELYVCRMPEKRRNEFDQWAIAITENKDYASLRARLIADCAVDESGALLFTRDDVDALAEKSSAVVRRISDAALRINKMRTEDNEAEAKNSGSGPDAASP